MTRSLALFAVAAVACSSARPTVRHFDAVAWSKNSASCATVADPVQLLRARAAAEALALPRTHSFVSLALMGVSCVRNDPALLGSADDKQLEVLADEALGLSAASEDEHYMLFEALYALRTAAHDQASAHALAERYLAFAEHAPAPSSDDERRARDQARLRAAVKAGVPERVIPVLEASERALPDDNTSARLAAAYAAAGRFGDAIAACTRGLARSPGPGGAVRLLTARATAHTSTGDVAAARRDLEAALDAAARIALAPARDAAHAQVRRQLDGLTAGK